MSCSRLSARRRLSVAAVGLLLVGCATAYAPQRLVIGHGFSDQRLGVRTWIVRVGNGWPNEQPRLTLFALYRAADAVVPDAIERDPAHDPTWAQHYLNWHEPIRTRVGRVRFRVLASEELP